MFTNHTRRATLHTVRALIAQIVTDGWELEEARLLAYEELRALEVEPRLIEQTMRRVAEAKTREELLKHLDYLVVSLRESRYSRRTRIPIRWRIYALIGGLKNMIYGKQHERHH